MARTAVRFLYLARHGEASPDEGTLTDSGRRQAALLGERLRRAPVSVIRHGPLPRAEETAQLIGEQLGDVPLVRSELAGDYLPHVPERHELPASSADFLLGRLERLPPGDCAPDPERARRSLAAFTGPAEADGPVHELVVTHTFLIGWLVRDALDAPKWRWMGLNHDNAALTVIRYAPGRPASLLLFNDAGHLPPELRGTGGPREVDV